MDRKKMLKKLVLKIKEAKDVILKYDEGDDRCSCPTVFDSLLEAEVEAQILLGAVLVQEVVDEADQANESV